MMQYGMSELVGECHPISPNAHHGSFTNAAPTGDCHDTFRKLSFSVGFDKFFIVYNMKYKLFAPIQG
jgi:hypothetical protein